MTGEKERELLDALETAELQADSLAVEQAVDELALFYVASGRFSAAVPYWRRRAELLAISTAPDSAELATCLHNMAATCLMPAGLLDEAHSTLLRARAIYAVHFRDDAPCVRDIDALLR